MQVASTAELKDLIKLLAVGSKSIIDLGNGIQLSEEGANLISLIASAPAVLRNANLIIPEFKALDDAGRAELLAYIPSVVSIPSSKTAEVVVEEILKLGVQLSKVLQMLS